MMQCQRDRPAELHGLLKLCLLYKMSSCLWSSDLLSDRQQSLINCSVFIVGLCHCSGGVGTWENGATKQGREKFSCHSQLYSKHRTIYTLKVKKGHLGKVLLSASCKQSQEQATHGNSMFFIETCKG